jgi:anthranilate synthase component 1
MRPLGVPPGVLRRLAVAHPERYPALLDSVAEGPLGQRSILAAAPREALWLDRSGRQHSLGVPIEVGGFLDSLERWWLRERAAPAASELAAYGCGWVVFVGYEMAQEVEPTLSLPPSPLPFNAFALRTRCALVHERATDEVYAVAEPDAAAALEMLCLDAQAAARALDSDWAEPPPGAYLVREEDPARFLERVLQAKEYIRAGDIYQVNLSRPWHIEPARGAGPGSRPFDVGQLYARLCAQNPAPFAALVQWGGVTLLSSSPERLVRVCDQEVQTRPIAGTRPRSRRAAAEAAETAALVSHPKERAEHIMLIDLERNDLGRVCEAGSVRVDELMVTETYAHVHHIVSNVRGRLRPGVTPVGALLAVFPGGTITGCPKFRCMQIIAELEGEGRGAYTGSFGFLSREGLMDLNILIRTMALSGERITLRAGAGIVADSDPQRELEETRAKARGLLAVFEPTLGERVA